MPAKSRITVAVVEEEALVRDMLVEHIERTGRYHVVLAVAHVFHPDAVGSEAFTKVAEMTTAPRVAVVGTRGAAGTIAWMKEHWPATRVLAILCERKADALLGAVRAGACGYVCRLTSHAEEIDEALDEVIENGQYQPADLLSVLAESDATAAEHERILASLTRIERKVLDHVCAPDLPNWQQVADRMFRDLSTIHSHRAHLFEKMHVGDVKAVVITGRAMGFGNGQW